VVLKLCFAVYAIDRSYGRCRATWSPLEQISPHRCPGLADFGEMLPLPSIRNIDKSSHWSETKSQSSDCRKVAVTITLKGGEGPKVDNTTTGKHRFYQVRWRGERTQLISSWPFSTLSLNHQGTTHAKPTLLHSRGQHCSRVGGELYLNLASRNKCACEINSTQFLSTQDIFLLLFC